MQQVKKEIRLKTNSEKQKNAAGLIIREKKSHQVGKIPKIFLFGKSKRELLKQIRQRLTEGKTIFIVTPNPEFIVASQKSLSFRKIINNATFAIPDGSYLFWARALQNQRRRLKSYPSWPRWRRLSFSLYWGLRASCQIHCGNLAEKRLSGTDLIPTLLRLASQKKGYVFFLGAQPGVAKKAAQQLKKMVPGWKLAGCRAGDSQPHGDQANRRAILGHRRHLFLLLVAYGMKKQEFWLQRNLPYLSVKIAMGVGGAFDYYSGLIPRAPIWWQRHGLEWLYRLWRQPWRWRRQLKLLQFLWLIINEQIILQFS